VQQKVIFVISMVTEVSLAIDDKAMFLTPGPFVLNSFVLLTPFSKSSYKNFRLAFIWGLIEEGLNGVSNSDHLRREDEPLSLSVT